MARICLGVAGLGLLAGMAVTLAAGRLDWEVGEDRQVSFGRQVIDSSLVFASGFVGLFGFVAGIGRNQPRWIFPATAITAVAYILLLYAASVVRVLDFNRFDDWNGLLSIGALGIGLVQTLCLYAALGGAVARARRREDERAASVTRAAGVILVLSTLGLGAIQALSLRGTSIPVGFHHALAAGVFISIGIAGGIAIRTPPPGDRYDAAWIALAAAWGMVILADVLALIGYIRDVQFPEITRSDCVRSTLFSLPARFLPGIVAAIGLAVVLEGRPSNLRSAEGTNRLT